MIQPPAWRVYARVATPPDRSPRLRRMQRRGTAMCAGSRIELGAGADISIKAGG